MMRVLISEPNASSLMTFLPYIWGILKTSSEQKPELAGRIDWLDPIFMRSGAAQSLAPYDLQTLDVLGLSCYTWNFELQCEIAKMVKAANPMCLTVAGGPDPDVKDPEFFRKHHYFDMVVNKDGEETFTALLLSLCRGERDFHQIPGLFLPQGAERRVVQTGAPRLPTGFQISPYVSQSEFYDKIIEQDPSRLYAATWETTRGCPYSCAFCDWGSNTMSKIRQFDPERVQSEVDWLFSRRLNNIFLADANFGILPRDLSIADSVVAAVSASEFKIYLIYSTAKNNPERSLEVSKKFAGCGLQYEQALALQHSNSAVLASVDRKNISPAKQLAFAKGLTESNIPIVTQMIIGLPGDSYAEWKSALTQLPEWHLHRDPTVFYFHILPNAPAAAPEYRREWEIKSISRRDREPSNTKGNEEYLGIPQEIIVGSKNFSTADWVLMNAFTSLFRALHSGGMTFFLAVFMRRSHGVSFRDFYDFVIENFVAKMFLEGQIHDWLVRIYENVLENEDAVIDQTTLPELADDTFTLCVTQAAIVRIAMNLDDFIDGLGAALSQQFPQVDKDLLASLVQYQRNMIALPDYDVARGKRFTAMHDWPGYFTKASTTDGEDMPEPLAVAATDVLVEDRVWTTETFPRAPKWTGNAGPDCWRQWAEFAMNFGARVAVVLHQQVRLVPVTAERADGGAREVHRIRNLIRTMAPSWLKSAIRRAGIPASSTAAAAQQ